MMVHTYTLKPMSLLSINNLHFRVSEIEPIKIFPIAYGLDCPPAHSDAIGENNTRTALKGCGVTGVTV